MKKFSGILAVIICVSVISGCSVDITIHNESGSSIPMSDSESTINDTTFISSTTTTTTTKNSEKSSTLTESTSTSTNRSTSATKKADKPTASKSTTTSAKQTSATTATTAKKDHGTPNINGTFHDDMAQEVLVMLNQERKAEGLGELKMDTGNMMNGAKIRAKEITVCWDHKRPDGESWNTVFDEEGIKYNARGENLADGHPTAESVFDGWMASPGHKANIMEPRFTHVSIACLEYNGHFYWVQLFGANVR